MEGINDFLTNRNTTSNNTDAYPPQQQQYSNATNSAAAYPQHIAANSTHQRRQNQLQRQDFIVIAEFSEREGPISPLTVPSELPETWKFNKSKFALRVLGSEFRKKKALGTLPSINVSDMQQFFEDDTNELYIYCYYTSIADFGARGYTRALCLTYITPTPNKIQRIFSFLSKQFTQSAMILKRAAQKTFLREIDQIIDIMEHKPIPPNTENPQLEYNDLFQCHLDSENRKNILVDMKEIRGLFGQKLLEHAQPHDEYTSNAAMQSEPVLMKRTRHRPHRVGKEGYKPLRELMESCDYNKFRDSLRSIHTQFTKNCLDIYVDHYNKELQYLNANRLFAIGSLSCLDIKPCHYLSPSWKSPENQLNHNDSMEYLHKYILNPQPQSQPATAGTGNMHKPLSPVDLTTLNVNSPPPTAASSSTGSSSSSSSSSATKSAPIHPNVFLEQNANTAEETGQDVASGSMVKSASTASIASKPASKKNRSSRRTPKPAQHLSGTNYNKNKFLKLYDKKMQRINRNHYHIQHAQNEHKHAISSSQQTSSQQTTKHVQAETSQSGGAPDDVKQQHPTNVHKEGEKEEKDGSDNEHRQRCMNNVWESFIMSRNKCDLEVHKETKKSRHDNNANAVSNAANPEPIPLASSNSTPFTPSTTPAHVQQPNASHHAAAVSCSALSVPATLSAAAKRKRSDEVNADGKRVRFRECSDKAREKNLSRCLLGRFRGFAEGILFTILTNRTLVILANDVKANREKVQKTVRALSLLIPGVENTNSTQEWREEPLYCHQLPNLKIVGMSSKTCHKSPDNIWDLITIIQFDDSILYGPPYKCVDESKSFVHRMLHPRKRFKTPDLFYRYLSRVMLEMSLHVFLFYYLSQSNMNNADGAHDDIEPNAYYIALLETLQFTQASDIDIAKHWCQIMQRQLYSLCNPIKPPPLLSLKSAHPQQQQQRQQDAQDDDDHGEEDVRARLLAKYGHRIPPIVKIT